MKPKIGIVTIHTDFNYGAVLQAVATQKFLELNGFDAEIIDYENSIISEQSKLIYKQDGKIKGYLMTFVRNTIFGRYRYFKKAIKNLDLYRKKSQKSYKTFNDLKDTPYEILVSGSDQIWNPLISRGLDPIFLLQFGAPKKRISISTSMGSYTLKENEKKIFREALATYSHISVREEFAKSQLQKLVNAKIKVLVDPTLLLTRKVWWDCLAKDSQFAQKKEKYIVTYFVGGNKNKYRPIIKEYSDALELPVWTIQYSNYNWKESTKKILGASIIDFIALIANADLVITDSFHGVAFSVNMETDFVALTNSGNPVRVKEFLGKLHLEKRIDLQAKQYEKIDYCKVRDELDEMRNDSANWIINAIME